MSRTSTMQPSTMGYVFKQDMPHHLSILFRARPPLEYAEPLEKGKCKPITSYFDGHRDYFALFENEEPPKKPEIERPMEKRKRMKEMKMMENLKKQEEDKKACKYLLIVFEVSPSQARHLLFKAPSALSPFRS